MTWEYKTVETGRKSGTTHADVWPEGDGWEVDTTNGRVGTPDAGWDRFDHHEELYFRRRVADPAPRSHTPGAADADLKARHVTLGNKARDAIHELAAEYDPPAKVHAGWTKVPDEPPLEFLKSINRDNQALVYENGRYYNAWFEFEPSEGGWLWTDDADSEPNPSHYRLLNEVAIDEAEAGR